MFITILCSSYLIVLAESHEAGNQLGELDDVLDHCRQLLCAVQPQILLTHALVELHSTGIL